MEFEQFPCLLAINLVKYVKSALYVDRWRKLKESNFDKSDFYILFGLSTETFRPLPGSFSRNFEKHSTCPEDYLQSNFFWKRLFKNLGFKDFKWSFTDSGENFFQGSQNCNKCPEEQIEEKPFRIEKNATSFNILNELSLSFFWRRSLAESSKLQSSSPWKYLKKYSFSKLCTLFQTCLDFEPKKEHWSRSFFQVCHNCHLLVIAIIWK